MSAYALTNDYAAHFVRRGGSDACARITSGLRGDGLVARPLNYAGPMSPGEKTLLIRFEDPPPSVRPAPSPVIEDSRPQRAAVVPVRFTPAERDQLLAVARDMGLSLSTYMRQVVLSRPLPPRRIVRPIPEVNRQTYQALGQVGGLLNQMACCLNEGRAKPEAVEVLKAIDLVARLLGSVRAEVLGTSFGEGRSS